MSRPTIRDLAEAAGVSVATVNRILAGAANVRQPTRDLVQDAAARIGFYGLGAIQGRIAATRPRYRFGVLLLQAHRQFYQALARALRAAAAACADAEIDLRIEFLDDLTPQNTAARARALAAECQALCITSAVHPVLSQAISDIQAGGVPVFALVGQLSATGQVHYVGLDNWKVGRTAAWFFDQGCRRPGKIGILMGNPRYRNQEMNEAGFRSYFREHGTDLTLLEPQSTHESAAVAQELTEALLQAHPDLVGLYVSGGGISGALTALRAGPAPGRIVTVGYDLMDVTRAGLLDGTLTVVIAHPLERLARAAVGGMVAAVGARTPGANHTEVIDFDIVVRESL